jgi:TonB family protein
LDKQLFGVTAALLLAIAGPISAQDKPNVVRMPKALSCEQPEWDKEARRYELEGKAIVMFDLDDEGRPVNPRTMRSSGWKLLDAMSERAVTKCRYARPSEEAPMRSGLVLAFNWKLAPRQAVTVPAALVAGSCPVSERYAEFRPLPEDVAGSKGTLVRFLVNSSGIPSDLRIEAADPPESRQAAEAYIASCRFTPETRNAVPERGSVRGRLIPRDA